MASSKEYLDHILELLAGLDEVSYRPMMGEYVIYRNLREDPVLYRAGMNRLGDCPICI